ncbi:flavin reductase family protein [Flammeovirga kamogawensis]|uniref:Flavin reductase n=1 Tax=Flammeovirga kamogawensis TaxID=373891 RepID=A0ABX8GTI9_9BACT|nr:flavin reductase [Flammeovirga kamogawensis]MBB6460045.1 flavin reductase (DIM6/NTAB) family NADH-FMN oxidoreductase RutF [Flammeovirga kamogawensis]QWG06909.1 flavin reductase [Flammeovirga kamogawensis]TRX68730.1 flavin oxidoreductase [Flammeovirga kamogawensis]
MVFTKNDIQNADRIYRLNLINSVTGIKPGNLIGTKDSDGNENLAIFSSVIHLGSTPALLGFITRPSQKVPRHTLQNIKETGVYTINHIPIHNIEDAHKTSAKFDKGVSEFDVCNFTPEYIEGFNAPYVKESHLKIGLRFKEEIPIPLNGTSLIIGEIENIQISEDCIDINGYIDLEKSKSAGISGLNTYYSFNKLTSFPYARVENFINSNTI